MFLCYVALVRLFLVSAVTFRCIVAVHDRPCEIAKRRNHPHPLPGRISVQFRITDPALAEYAPPEGIFGQAAVCSEHLHHVGVLRKVLLRMSSWMSCVFPVH